MLILQSLKSCFYFSHPKSSNLDRMFNSRKMIWREYQMQIFLRRWYVWISIRVGDDEIVLSATVKEFRLKHAQTQELKKCCLTCLICLCYYDRGCLLSSPEHSLVLFSGQLLCFCCMYLSSLTTKLSQVNCKNIRWDGFQLQGLIVNLCIPLWN